MAVPGSSRNKSDHVFHAANSFFLQSLNVHTLGYVFSDMQSVGLWVKQVNNLFVVYFEVAGLDQELHLYAVLLCLSLLLLHTAKNVLERSLHYASKLVGLFVTILGTDDLIFVLDRDGRTLNGIGLTRACLSVGKD